MKMSINILYIFFNNGKLIIFSLQNINYEFNLTAWQKLCLNFQKQARSHIRNRTHILSRFNHTKDPVPP